MSEHSGDEKKPEEDEEIPRRSILATMPKRTFYRVVVLLAALAGIIYLQRRTAAIAGCMSNSFQALPPPHPTASPSRARVQLPATPAPGPE